MEPIYAYCERLGPGLWAEPVNALTNAAFLMAAAVTWRRWPDEPLCRALSAILGVIGLGSFLFHTFAFSMAKGSAQDRRACVYTGFREWRRSRRRRRENKKKCPIDAGGDRNIWRCETWSVWW